MGNSPIFLPFSSHFPQPHPATTLHNPHPVCYARYFFIPPPTQFPPFFQTPQSWFGELVRLVAVSMDAWKGARCLCTIREAPACCRSGRGLTQTLSSPRGTTPLSLSGCCTTCSSKTEAALLLHDECPGAAATTAACQLRRLR